MAPAGEQHSVDPTILKMESERPKGVQVRRVDLRYQALFDAVKRAIDEADPIRLLAIGAPSDEYAPELGTILPRIADVTDEGCLATVLHEEFSRWFGSDTAGPGDAYMALASRLWPDVQKYRRG